MPSSRPTHKSFKTCSVTSFFGRSDILLSYKWNLKSSFSQQITSPERWQRKKGCLCECVCGIKSKCDLATPILQKSKGFPLKIKLSSNKRVFIWTWDVAAAILLALCILLQELSSQWDGISNLHQYGSRQKGNKTPADLGKWPMARTSSSREGEKGSFSFDCFYSIQGTSKWWEP